MKIQRAAQQTTVLEAAIAYVVAGYSVVPVEGKQPAVAWQDLQTNRPTVSQVNQWHKWGVLEGVAVIAGRVSRNLAIIDLDGQIAMGEFYRRFPELTNTYTVRSANGLHLYYHTPEPLKTTRIMNWRGLKEIGLRGEGSYTVAPPSPHPSGCHYVVAVDAQVMRHDLRPVMQWVHTLLREKHPPPPTNPAPVPAGTGANPRYVEWVVSKELDRVRRAAPGERNDMLNIAAYCLGRLVGNPDSGLTRGNIEQQLAAAAADLAADDGVKSVYRTIKSGLDAGMSKPLRIPAPREAS
jgi:hypothetical protein